MESIQKIILILGIPSSGKTTFARTLSKVFDIDIVQTDYIYFDIADRLKINGIKNFPSCKEWWSHDKSAIHSLKVTLYKEKLTSKDIIIEGFGLCFKEDRDIIKELFPKASIFVLYKKVNYQQWFEYKNKVCTKTDCERTKQEYEDLANRIEFTSDIITI